MKLSRPGLRPMAMIAGVILIATPHIAQACLMCGLPPGDHAAFAFHASVLFMMLSPYAIFGIIGGIVYASWRAAMKKRRAGAVRHAQ